MRVRIMMGMALCALLYPAALIADGLPATAQLLPAGFTIEKEIRNDAMVMIEAKKPNAGFPDGFENQDISVSCSWTASPAAKQSVDAVAQEAEEPAQGGMGISRDEPAGKERYKGGVLICRKVISSFVGMGEEEDLVTWKLSWIGAASEGMLVFSVSNFYGSKEAARALIDGMIAKAAR